MFRKSKSNVDVKQMSKKEKKLYAEMVQKIFDIYDSLTGTYFNRSNTFSHILAKNKEYEKKYEGARELLKCLSKLSNSLSSANENYFGFYPILQNHKAFVEIVHNNLSDVYNLEVLTNEKIYNTFMTSFEKIQQDFNDVNEIYQMEIETHMSSIIQAINLNEDSMKKFRKQVERAKDKINQARKVIKMNKETQKFTKLDIDILNHLFDVENIKKRSIELNLQLNDLSKIDIDSKEGTQKIPFKINDLKTLQNQVNSHLKRLEIYPNSLNCEEFETFQVVKTDISKIKSDLLFKKDGNVAFNMKLKTKLLYLKKMLDDDSITMLTELEKELKILQEKFDNNYDYLYKNYPFIVTYFKIWIFEYENKLNDIDFEDEAIQLLSTKDKNPLEMVEQSKKFREVVSNLITFYNYLNLLAESSKMYGTVSYPYTAELFSIFESAYSNLYDSNHIAILNKYGNNSDYAQISSANLLLIIFKVFSATIKQNKDFKFDYLEYRKLKISIISLAYLIIVESKFSFEIYYDFRDILSYYEHTNNLYNSTNIQPSNELQIRKFKDFKELNEFIHSVITRTYSNVKDIEIENIMKYANQIESVIEEKFSEILTKVENKIK